jgi:hypothetical protein
MFTPNKLTKLTHPHNHKTQEKRFDVVTLVQFVNGNSNEFQDMEKKILYMFQFKKKYWLVKYICHMLLTRLIECFVRIREMF